MGWVFQGGHHKKTDLVADLAREETGIAGTVRTLKKTLRGNTLWAVQEYEVPGLPAQRSIVAFELRKDGATWGFKEFGEASAPNTSCPLVYFDLAPPPDAVRVGKAMSESAARWRESVRAYHKSQKPTEKIVAGQVYYTRGISDPLVVRIDSVKPLVARDHTGVRYRLKKRDIGARIEGERIEDGSGAVSGPTP